MNICSFSPDGGALAFVPSDRTLKKVSLSDGLVTTLVGDVDYDVGGGVWGPDGRITFVRAGTLWRVSANGGPAEQLTTLDTAQNERVAPVANGRCRLRNPVYVCVGCRPHGHQIESVSLVTKERRVVIGRGEQSSLHGERAPAVLPRRRRARGALRCRPTSSHGTGSRGAEGHQPGSVRRSIADHLGCRLARLHSRRTGDETARLGVTAGRRAADHRRHPTLQESPPLARRAAYRRRGGRWRPLDSGHQTIDVYQAHDVLTPWATRFAVWTPDGRGVLFRTLTGIRQVDPDSGAAIQVLGSTTLFSLPTSVSPDGQTLAYIQQTSETGGDLYTLSLQGEPQPRAVVKTPAYDGGGAVLSGRSLVGLRVRTSQASSRCTCGRTPGPTGRCWSRPRAGRIRDGTRNGKELFYRNGNKMMVVDVSTTSDLRLSAAASAVRATIRASAVPRRLRTTT